MDFAGWVAGLREDDDARHRPHRTYREVWNRVAEIAGAGRVAVEAFGATVGGEPLWAVTVGEGDATVLVFANLHAMEHAGVEVALALLARAAAGEAGWGTRRLVVVPIVNADGYLAVERSLAAGRRRFHRGNGRGVDLNRNFAEFWDPRYVWNRLTLFGPGDAPLSEPETRALDALAGRARPDYVVSLHAFGEWIILPFAGSRQEPPQLEAMRRTAREMAARQPLRPYRVIRLAERTRLFSARGAEIDHFHRRHGAQSFLIEIGAGPRLTEPEGWLWPYRWYTPSEARLARDVANVVPALDYLSVAGRE